MGFQILFDEDLREQQQLYSASGFARNFDKNYFHCYWSGRIYYRT
jgi:hypothetical protein